MDHVTLRTDCLLLTSEMCAVTTASLPPQQRDDAQERLLELMDENARLELEKRSSFNESASLEEELQQARLQVAPSGEAALTYLTRDSLKYHCRVITKM